VINQSYPVSEIIVVDDGSTDDTREVVQKIGNSVKYIYQDNRGPASARNTGIRNSGGDWVAFLDADDEWTPNHIRTGMELLKRHPEIVWYCAAREMRYENGTPINKHGSKMPLAGEGVIDDYFKVQALTTFSATSAMFVKRTVFEEIGLFNEILHRGEDLDLWFRIALKHPRIAYSNKVGCIYWRVGGSLTTKNKSIDIPRYLDRIEISRQSSQNCSAQILKQSTYLVQAWVISAIKCAILQSERDSLTMIRRRYEHILPVKWKIILWIFEHSVPLQAAKVGLSIRADKSGRT